MDQSTTALDVLSHAATLVEAKGSSKDEIGQKHVDCRTSPLKELPTREHKIKRSKDRRDLPAAASLRVRIKGDSCLSQISSDNEADKESLAFTENSLSPVPGEQSSHVFKTYSDTMNSFTHLQNRHHDSGNGNKALKETPTLPHFYSDQQQAFLSSDDDQPLDMSKKCSWHSNQPSALTPDTSNQIKIQQHRPSVITCASALLRTQCNLKDPVHHNFENLDETNFKKDQRQNCSLSSDSDCNGNSSEETRPGHRREILSGMCDPVIEEHFRRSLGKDYSNIFSTSAASVSVTVDDHFAKALGETWLRLQQPKPPVDLVSSSSSSPTPPSSTKVPAQPQASSSFLQHSPSNLHSLQCVEEIA